MTSNMLSETDKPYSVQLSFSLLYLLYQRALNDGSKQEDCSTFHKVGSRLT